MDNSLHENDLNKDDEINLIELLSFIWGKKKIIFTFTTIAAILSVLYSLSLPNIYTSNSILLPSDPKDSLSSKFQNLSTIGNITGFSFPSAEITKSQEGMERIKSFEFFTSFFLPNIKLENLMAVKKWNPKENKIIYNDRIYNKELDSWVMYLENPKKNKPTPQEAYKRYKNIISIEEDKKTFIKISVNHQSPYIAKMWLDLIINQINESMRYLDQDQAKKSISFLNEAQKTTNLQSMKEVISILLEGQMQILMLTSSNENYVYKIIDSPIVAEEKSGPSRSIICIIGTLLGGVMSLLAILIQNLRKKIT